MKRLILFLILFIAVERFCHFQTEGFALSKMLLCTPSNASPSQNHDDLFSKPLTLIGAGKQYYAFETADHQYVVKFMKFSRRRPLPWLEKLPLPLDNYIAERAKRLAHLETSGRLALESLSEEAGLLNVPPLQKKITLIDKCGICHTIDLDQTRFFVQKKAIPFTDYFSKHPSPEIISSYIQTIAAQCRKGICNLDPLSRNFGVAENRVLLMDIGSFLAHPKLNTRAGQQRELFVELLSLREWLSDNYPAYLPVFDQELRSCL